MLIAATDKEDLLAPGTQTTHIDVRRQVGPRDVPDMQRTVRVRERGGHGGSSISFTMAENSR